MAGISYGLNPLFALPLYGDGLDPISVLFFRYMLSVPMLTVVLLCMSQHQLSLRDQFRSITLHQWLHMGFWGIVMAVSSITLFVSYLYMDAGIASTILFVYPLMTALLMTLIFHERLSIQTVICLLTASLGIGLLYKGEGGETLSWIGLLIVLLSAISYSFYLVFLRRGCLQTVPPVLLTFVTVTSGALFLGLCVLLRGELVLPSTLPMWGLAFGSALFPTAISLVFTTFSLSYIGSTNTSILGAVEPITALLCGILVFGERLTILNGVGIALVLLSVLVVIRQSK